MVHLKTFWYIYKKEHCTHLLTTSSLSKVKMVHWWLTFWYVDKKDQTIMKKTVFDVVVVVVVVSVLFVCCRCIFVMIKLEWRDKSFSKQKQAIELWFHINRAQKPASILKLVVYYIWLFFIGTIISFTLTFKQYCPSHCPAGFGSFRVIRQVLVELFRRDDTQNRRNKKKHISLSKQVVQVSN